ncbi:MAG: LytR C-terminal domain-containing protein [Candidatus Kapabacteria bacterium]|nr:LytR C-terminal domain-containing protein [Ignavibacteria bacterium]MBP6509168.1 LytR C-terminal domain-containing protein [Candidatus Kapabacteria bacterium]MBK6418625.1 LytR C-terminal domain-containing protein [Ignavibacteria bacterium]MBK6760590.1 LytR C-terminal domain-containing protein [Ignavibacteria bacterium]MBK7032552.1 LytR C-terminal domain-containing protein [Ignavibacteria bacterium]
MTAERRRPIWPWVLIAALGVVVVAFLGSLVWRLINPPVSPLVNEDDPRSTIQVDVVNASGRQGAGRHTLEFLRERGFDVVEISSTGDRPKRSLVIDRMGDKVSARKIANALGIADTLIVTEIDSMRFVRATIMLGSDIDKLEPFLD